MSSLAILEWEPFSNSQYFKFFPIFFGKIRAKVNVTYY